MTSESPVPSIQCPEIVQEKKLTVLHCNFPPQFGWGLLDFILLGLLCSVYFVVKQWSSVVKIFSFHI